MRRSRKRFGKYFVSCYIFSQLHIPYVVQPLLAVVKAVCCAALASSVMASRYLVCGIMWRLWRRCLCPVGHIRYVAPVEQCCQCLVGHIRHVACGAVLPMPSGASLQMHILHVIVNVTVCRAALACSVIANSGACMQEL